MNDNTTITAINDDDMYVATIRLFSKGRGLEVATTLEVSHVLSDDFEGDIPASYGAAREIIMSIRDGMVMYSATAGDEEYLADPNISPEEKVARILEAATAQEEVQNATIN